MADHRNPLAFDTSKAVDVSNHPAIAALLQPGGKIPSEWVESSGGSGDVTGASNLGATGFGLFVSKIAGILGFKKIKAGANITITEDSPDSITIAASGGGGGGDIDASTTAETDEERILTPDGAGGVEWIDFHANRDWTPDNTADLYLTQASFDFFQTAGMAWNAGAQKLELGSPFPSPLPLDNGYDLINGDTVLFICTDPVDAPFNGLWTWGNTSGTGGVGAFTRVSPAVDYATPKLLQADNTFDFANDTEGLGVVTRWQSAAFAGTLNTDPLLIAAYSLLALREQIRITDTDTTPAPLADKIHSSSPALAIGIDDPAGAAKLNISPDQEIDLDSPDPNADEILTADTVLFGAESRRIRRRYFRAAGPGPSSGVVITLFLNSGDPRIVAASLRLWTGTQYESIRDDGAGNLFYEILSADQITVTNTTGTDYSSSVIYGMVEYFRESGT